MIKGKINNVMVFSLAEAIDCIMRDEVSRSPHEIMRDLSGHGISPTRQALHKTIRKMLKEKILRRTKYGKYEYIPLPFLPDMIESKKIESAIELQLLHESQELESHRTIDDQNKEHLNKLFADGKMFTTGKGDSIQID